MSTEEFIYSVINSDNVAQLDLNVIANTLASVDSLIRQIKNQQVENENLKEKISSLRTSALQIKQLYEDELGKNKRTLNREEDYIRQLAVLEARALTAENARVNAELREKETVAELDRQLQSNKDRYNSLACDMVRNCSLLLENNLLPSDQQMRFRDVKSYIQSLIQCGKEVPEDVVASLNRKRTSRRHRRSESEVCDQSTMTTGVSSISVGVNTTGKLSYQLTSSTSTHDPVEESANRSSDDIAFTANLKKSESGNKTFVDKSTMYSSSTITRSTCTSAFIKKIDVGVNFPEVIPKFINDILRECVIELPSPLTPILDDIPVHRESVHTQTEPMSIDLLQPKPQIVHCGTNTNLRNIRRKLDYVRKMENLPVNSHLLTSIKKEESVSPAAPIITLPAAFPQPEDHPGVNPQLTQIWALLGDTMFRLLGGGRIFDNQCYTTLNERVTMINNLIDSNNLRGTHMMNKVFEAASAAIISGEKGYGDDKHVTGRQREDQVESVRVSQEKTVLDREEDPTTLDERLEDEPLDTILSESCLDTDETNACATVDDLLTDRETETAILAENSASSLSFPVESEFQQYSNLETIDEAGESEKINNTPLSAGGLFPEPDLLSAGDESNDFSALIQQNIDSVCTIDSVHLNASTLEENDEIAKELRLMEEGNLPTNDLLPDSVNFSTLFEASEKNYLHVARDEDSVSSADDEYDRMLIVECSPSKSPASSSSCTTIGNNGTLISPIKVKETNKLVKDQFKTPTSPAISKRKLRDRLEGVSPKRGRMSPTTETLLEDDWDRKLLTIKNYFSFPLSLHPIEDSGQGGKNVEFSGDKGSEENTAVRENVELCIQHGEIESIHGDIDKTKDSNRLTEDLLYPMETQVATSVITANLPSSKESAVKETVASSSQWDDFKVPLRIDTEWAVATACNTDSPESPLIEDSPMSPMPETEMDKLSSSWESPMSPPIEGRMCIYNEIVEPKIIPLEHACASRFSQDYISTPIAKSIACYKKDKRAEVLRKLAPEASKTETALIRKVVQGIKSYIKNEWTVETLQQSCIKLVELTNDTRIISLAMLESVVSYGDMPVDVQCSPPAPPLPKVVQQLVLLVKTLNESFCDLDKVLLQEIDRKVFTLKSDKVKMDGLIASTYLYIGISDCNRMYGCTARLYIYKSLYYFNFKGLPLVYYVLKAFPHALPKKSSPHYDNSDPMVSTIRTVLMNINYMERANSPNAHIYKKSELLKLLKFFYGYQQGSPTYEELIVNLVEKIKANKLRNVDYCLILVAKRKGYDWAKTHIVQKYLYPLLNDYLKRLDVDGTLNEQIACLIFTISSILKTQPNSQDITGIMQILGGIVQMTDGNQKVQEAAVAALLRMTRFGFADIYEWLCRWCPKYDVSSRTKLMLATFVHRKEQRFWQQLCQRTIV
ncbi:uncharacterized protein LOC129724890 [Wyeomyia smithii]|uniref:uncharacterized protein LOC129724890 n=1 Tax=Wyeomyia smithii TaxID=174621 RepID=UPI0024681463|nr:uncharacterized protein LOC129724890 [Wyeomyia smithii]